MYACTYTKTTTKAPRLTPTPQAYVIPENFHEGHLQLIQSIKSRATRSASVRSGATLGSSDTASARTYSWITSRRCSTSCQFGASARHSQAAGVAIRAQTFVATKCLQAPRPRSAQGRPAGACAWSRQQPPGAARSAVKILRRLLWYKQVLPHAGAHFSLFLLLGCQGSWVRPWRGRPAPDLAG